MACYVDMDEIDGVEEERRSQAPSLEQRP
jgi:hypothetical protein